MESLLGNFGKQARDDTYFLYIGFVVFQAIVILVIVGLYLNPGFISRMISSIGDMIHLHPGWSIFTIVVSVLAFIILLLQVLAGGQR